MNKASFFPAFCIVAAAMMIACKGGNTTKKEEPNAMANTPAPAMETAAFNAGVFKGTIPGGTTKRDVSITFNTDSTFSLKEAYLSKEGKPEHEMENIGKWSYNSQSKEIALAYRNLADRGTTFTVIDDNTIQMHDRSMQTPMTSGPEYNLRRQ
ncbi:copper resistance protein NlpE N-terminal domain-containing protein [Chitinophaga sp. HK235]|uniref:copper resistance protein NlpE N-terminal domain-containing protein n=1 Tax=Chitinophaga sp. HK235 TaxID=2952571 RepID=UPI001BA4CA2E|nr:copper resistance protein NlpE N-terminal domain-containing protein [Chitinophaga sp. HK235]